MKSIQISYGRAKILIKSIKDRINPYQKQISSFISVFQGFTAANDYFQLKDTSIGTMANHYELFKNEHPSIKISQTKFRAIARDIGFKYEPKNNSKKDIKNSKASQQHYLKT